MEVKLAGMFGLSGIIIFTGYLFYDKNENISILLLITGIILASYIIMSEIKFKQRRHEAPWLFKKR